MPVLTFVQANKRKLEQYQRRKRSGAPEGRDADYRNINGLAAARVRVPDLRGEEFEEAIRRALARGGHESGSAIGEDGGKQGHELHNMYLTA